MAENDKAVADATPAAEVSAEQVKDSAWPKPGDEGYVTPDGTEQSRRQLAENRQAAADRMAAGSTVHGAPMATPVPQVRTEGEAAVARADAYSGKTDADRRAGVTKFIREGLEGREAEAAKRDEADRKAAESASDQAADVRTADVSKGRTVR